MRKTLILAFAVFAVLGLTVPAQAAPVLGGPVDVSLAMQRDSHEFCLAKPANTVEGDLLIAHIAYRIDTPFTLWLEYESGWYKMEQVEHSDYQNYVMATFSKRAGANEPSQYRWYVSDPAHGGGTDWVGAVARFTGAASAHDGSCNMGEGTVMTAPSTYAPADSLLLALYCKRYGSMPPPAGMTQLYQYYGQYPQLTVAAFSEVRTTAGYTGNRVTSDSWDTEWFAQLVALYPAAPSAPVVVVHPVDWTVTYGQDAYFYANINGIVAPFPAVQWQCSADEGLTWTDIPGATTIRWTLARPPVAWNGYLIRAVFDNGVGEPVATESARLTVNRKPLTAAAVNQTKDYDGLVFPYGSYEVAYSGMVAGEDSSAVSGEVTFGGTAIEATLPGTYPIALSGDLSADNYSIGYAGGTLTINRRPVAVAADAQSKTYGDPDPELTYQITSGSLLAGDEFSGSLVRTAGENAGNYWIQQGTLALGDNYALTYVGANLSIQPMPLTVAAEAKTKTYGDPDPALSYQITSGRLVGSDRLWIRLQRVAGEMVGEYEIRNTYLFADPGYYNYVMTYVPANLTIDPRPVTIAADPKTKKLGDADPALTYEVTAGNLILGDSFTGALSREPGESVGTYQILQGTVSLSANYELVYVPAEFTIAPRQIPVTIAAVPQSKVYGEDDPELTYTITSDTPVPPDGFTGALSRVAGETVGSYEIQQGSLALSDDYVVTYVPADLSITPRPVTITADPQAKTYGDDDPALTYRVTAGSLAFSDAFTGALTREAGETVGTYEIRQGTVTLGSDYSLSYVPADLEISPRAITVTADEKTKGYGEPDPAFTWQVTAGSLAFSDEFTGDLTREAGETVGSYRILQGTLALSDDYALSYVPDYLTVTVRPVTITADPQAKTYGDDDPALTYRVTAGSLAFSDAFTGALTREAGETVGTYEIRQGTVTLGSDYSLSYVPADLEISPRAVTVTADAATKIYGEPDPALTYRITSGSLVAGDDFTGALARAPGENPGIYHIVQGTLALSGNYKLDYEGADLSIVYGLETLLAPYSAPAHNFKVGMTLPLKWQYTDCHGDVMVSSSANPQLQIYRLAGSGETLIDTVEPDKRGLKYEPKEQMWMYTWSTKGLQAGAYRIVVTSRETGQVQAFELELTE